MFTPPRILKNRIILLSFTILFVASSFLYTESGIDTKTSTSKEWYLLYPPTKKVVESDRYVFVDLENMTLSMHDNDTVTVVSLITKGRPGSYFETIGGSYISNYKIPNHFSSIGHVYMPWSVHVFGNYFIHGIPYYPDGTNVASEYSGGCIRLSNEDAKKVYDFVQQGTPIILSQNKDTDFLPTDKASSTLQSIDMTRLMVATVSLEVLSQDNELYDSASKTATTRRKLLPRLLIDKNDAVSLLYAQALGGDVFLEYMNTRAKTLGLSNTTFTSLTEPASTTEEDFKRFIDHIHSYKGYLVDTVK